MMQLDRSHPTVEVLQNLLPELIVSGGSFSSWLKSPAKMEPAQRRVAFETARQKAVEQCVERLAVAGLSRNSKVPMGDGGERLWPSGFVGSLTHKGTVVLGAIARTSLVAALGIDLERKGDGGLTAVASLIDSSQGSGRSKDQEITTLQSFSAKEAIFKAQYPITHRNLSFSDVHIRWSHRKGRTVHASGSCSGAGPFEVRLRWIREWLIAIAYLRAGQGVATS